MQNLREELRTANERFAGVIRRHLEALARHPDEAVRCVAYRILLLDEPMPDYSGVFPAFVESKLTFLSPESIRAIARSGFGDRRLQSLRRRLFSYRRQLEWPAAEVTRAQFVQILRLLADFAARDPGFFAPVRAELASSSLHRADPVPAAEAERSLAGLDRSFESHCA